MRRTARVVVDSGTQAGIHVPVRAFRSILKVSSDQQYIHSTELRRETNDMQATTRRNFSVMDTRANQGSFQAPCELASKREVANPSGSYFALISWDLITMRWLLTAVEVVRAEMHVLPRTSQSRPQQALPQIRSSCGCGHSGMLPYLVESVGSW